MAAEAQAPGGAHHASTEAAGKHEGSGLPQFEFATWPGQIVQFLVIFTVLLILLTGMTGRLRKAIDRRGRTIAEALAQARALRDEAEAQSRAAEAEIAEARAQAQRTAAEAKARAKTEAAQRSAAEEARLAARLAEAEGSIRAARDQAMTHVRGIAAETAQAVVVRLTGDTPDLAAVQAAVDARA